MSELHPSLDFADLIAQRTRHFTGREWVFEWIGDWLGNTSDPLFFITGGPGSGKSSVSCRLAQFSMGLVASVEPRLARDSIVFAQFCQAQKNRTLDPRSFVTSLSVQIARRIPEYAQELANIGSQTVNLSGSIQVESMEGGLAGGIVIKNLNIGELSARVAFNRVVSGPLETALAAAAAEQDLVVLVDGLDEALTYSTRDTIVHLLKDVMHDLPPGLRFIVAGRPDKRVLSRIGKPNLDLTAEAPPNNTDVENYLASRLAGSATASDELIRDIAAQSDGNFLYAQHVARGIVEGDIDPTSDDWRLPADLHQIYEEFCDRELEDNDPDWSRIYRPMLSALAVANEPGLTRAHLEGVTGAKASEIGDALTVVGQYLQPPGTGEGPFQIYHESFREFLLDEKFRPEEANLEIADYLLDYHAPVWSVCDDAYALRHTPTHLADAINGRNRKRDHANLLKLVELVSDTEFQQTVERITGDLAGLRDQLFRTLRVAVRDPLPTSSASTVESALNMVLFEQEFLHPDALFVLAREKRLEQALARLELLCTDNLWLPATRLALAWEAGDPDSKVVRDVLAAGMGHPDLDILARRIAGQPVDAGALPPPPDPILVQAILKTMGGDVTAQGLAEVLLGGDVNVITGIETMGDEAPLYLAEAHAPHLVAAAIVPERITEATAALRDYIRLHAGNKYVYYRNRSLFAILKEALKHPDDGWLHALLPELCSSSLLSGERFSGFLPMALEAVAAKSGDAVATACFDERARRIVERAETVVADRTGDPWSRTLRELAALAECSCLAFRNAGTAREQIERAGQLKKGYAGFRAPATAFLAESAIVVGGGGDQNVGDMMHASLQAAQNIQDPYFCLETTTRVNALIKRLEAQAEDVAKVVETFVDMPESREFQALFIVGEGFSERVPGPQKLELPPEFGNANTIAGIADIFWTSMDELLRVNDMPPGTEGDILAADEEITIPDQEFRPWLAAQLAAVVLADGHLTDRARSRLIQRLVPAAVPNRTCLDAVLARLVLASAEIDDNLSRDAKRFAGLAERARASGAGQPDSGLDPYSVIHYTRF